MNVLISAAAIGWLLITHPDTGSQARVTKAFPTMEDCQKEVQEMLTAAEARGIKMEGGCDLDPKKTRDG